VRTAAHAPRTLGVPKPSYDEFEFYLRLDELARHIVDKLRHLRAQGDNPTVIPPKPAPPTPDSAHRATVFLAEVTDDLHELRFEEIFRYYQQGAEDEAAAFVSLLLAGSEHPDVYVVITMRSDFLGDCALFHGLPEAINQGLFLTPRLNREQLRAAIEEPAAVFGGKIEPALVNHLLNDAGNNPDQLPVVQHALMRMWTIASTHPSPAGGDGKDEGITLTMDHYAQIGGLDAALSQHADEAYNELDPSQHKIAEIMFRSLSERGSDRRDTRRPVPLTEVAAVAKVPWQEVAAVVEVFRQEGRSFLMPPVGKDLEPDSILDISHESLIRQWQRLQDWTT